MRSSTWLPALSSFGPVTTRTCTFDTGTACATAATSIKSKTGVQCRANGRCMFTEVPRAFLEAENIIADQSARAATRYLLEFTYPAGICRCGPGVPGVGGSQRINRGGLQAGWYPRAQARTITLLSNRAGGFDGHSNIRRHAGGPLDLRLCDPEYAAPEYGGQPLWPVHVPHLNGQQYSCKPRYALRRHGTIVLTDRHRSDRQVDGRRGAAQLGPVAHHHALSGARAERSSLWLDQAAVLQHRVDLGRATAPGGIQRREILGVPAGENHLPEAIAVRAREPAILIEPLEGIVGEHLRPKIGVVAGRVATGKDVLEIARAIARRHGVHGDVCLVERRLLESIRILQRGTGRQHVPLHVELGCGEELRHVIALVEVLCPLDLRSELRRHDGAGLIVARVMLEDRRVSGPVLVELRGKLDEISRRRGPGNARVFGVGEHPMQSMAELVEHRDDIVEADERRLPGCRLR